MTYSERPWWISGWTRQKQRECLSCGLSSPPQNRPNWCIWRAGCECYFASFCLAALHFVPLQLRELKLGSTVVVGWGWVCDCLSRWGRASLRRHPQIPQQNDPDADTSKTAWISCMVQINMKGSNVMAYVCTRQECAICHSQAYRKLFIQVCLPPIINAICGPAMASSNATVFMSNVEGTS